MSTIHFKLTTTATPEQFIAGLTDFGPGRGKLFGNSTDRTSSCTKRARPMPTSQRVREVFGND